MWKNKEVVETTETLETTETKEVETKGNYPKTYIHKDKESELMFWNTKFTRWEVEVNKEQEESLFKTLDYQYWFIKEEV